MASPVPDQHEQFYVVGGNLRPDAPSYVPRQADDDLYDALSRGEFCYILTSRQMGKSSLIVRTGMRLAQDGVHVVTLDLTGIGQNLTPEQWYSGLLLNIGGRLDLEDELDDFWEEHEHLSPVQRLVEALRRVALPGVEGRVVLFLDEIDVAQSLPFSANEFFAAIRHCYTRRAEDAEFERLSFCLAGVATPSDLIDDPLTTPFNIGTRIELADFSEDEGARLAVGLGRDPAVASALISRILHWTNGHPYLTQRMCQAVQADASVQTGADVDRLCEELFFSERARDQDPNLQFVRSQMLWRDIDHAALLAMYGDIVRGKNVANDDANPLTSVLRLSGVVRVEGGHLRARNAIYEHVFDRVWVRESMPDAELRRQRAAARRAMIRTGSVAAVVIALLAFLAAYAGNKGTLAAQEAHERVRTLAVAQADKGRQMLRNNDVNGLLHFAEARRTAKDIPDLAASVAEEWAMWHWQLDGRLLQVFGHDSEVTAMGFSPDGRLFVTGSAGGTAQLWNTATGGRHGGPLVHGSRIGQDPRWYQHSPTWTLVSFSADAGLVALAGMDGHISIWNTKTGQRHLPSVATGEHIVAQMTFDQDDALVAYAQTPDQRKFLWRWDMRDGSALLAGAPVLPTSLGILTPDGSKILNMNGFRVVDVASAGVDWTIDESSILSSAAWSDSLIVAGRLAGGDLVQVYDWQGNALHGKSVSDAVGATLTGQGQVQVEAAPDGKSFITITDTGIRQWDFATGEPAGPPILHEGWMAYRSISADSRLLAGAFGSAVAVWDFDTGEQVVQPILHTTPIKGLLFHPTDPHILAVQSVDVSVRLWNVGPATRYRSLASYGGDPTVRQFPSSMVAFSPTGQLVAASSDRDADVAIRNVETGRPHVKPLTHDVVSTWKGSRTGGPQAIAFSPDGEILAVASDSHGTYLWDVATGSKSGPVKESQPVSLAFSPDGSKLAWLRWRDPVGNALQMWDLGSEHVTTHSFGFGPQGLRFGHVADPGGVDFDSTGERILLLGHLGGFALYDTRDMTQVGRRMRLEGRSDCARLSPDDSLIVTASEDASAQLWDVATQRPYGPPMSHGKRVRWANFSPDGSYVGTASDDMTAQIWDVDTGKRVSLPLRHSSAVLCIEFSPDGRYVATGAAQDARLWKLPQTPATLGEVARRTALATGRRLDAEGKVEPLPWQEWQALRVGAATQ